MCLLDVPEGFCGATMGSLVLFSDSMVFKQEYFFPVVAANRDRNGTKSPLRKQQNGAVSQRADLIKQLSMIYLIKRLAEP